MKSKKNDINFQIIKFLLAILIAFGISFVILLFTTSSPLIALKDLLIGPLTSVRRFSTVLEIMIPVAFAGLAVTLMFRANQFNLASEGAMFMGALVSAIVGIYFNASPMLVKISAMFLAGCAGALITVIPGILKVKWNASELVSSIMLNYVMLYFGLFIFSRYARDPDQAFSASFKLGPDVRLTKILSGTRLHTGIIILLIFVILSYIFLYKTKWGYKLRIVGSNTSFAKTIGISTTSVILTSQLLGGFLAGLGGSVEMLGIYSRFQWTALPGYGFDGVIVAILAKENPMYVPLAAFFLSYLRIGADYMYRQSDVASEIVAIIQGLVIVLIAADAFLAKYRHRQITKESKEITA